MPQTILGIDIGSYSVKVAEIVRTFKSFAFVHFYERKIQYNDVLTRDESITAAIQAVLEDQALTWDACYAALPGKVVATRFLDFPFGQAKRVDQALEFELENHIPFPLEEVVFDYHIATATKEAATAIVFYAPKAEFAKCLTLFANAGLDPKRLCVEGVELVNLVHLGLVPPEVPYALIDIGHEKTTVTICRGKRLTHTRTLTIGGHHLTQAIAERLNISAEEAERLKCETAQTHLEGEWPPEDSIPYHVAKAIDAVLEELLLHLRQTFLTFRERTGETVEGIYLCGGTARLQGIDQYLSLHLKQNVTFLNCLEFHFTQVDRAEAPSAVVPQALALALRGVAVPGLPDVNFRRGEFAYRGDVQQLGGGIRRAAIAAGCVVLMAVGYFSFQYVMLSRKAEQLNKEVVQLVTQALGKEAPKSIADANAAVKILKGKQDDVAERTSRLEAVLKTSVLEVLKDISAQLPARDKLQLDVEMVEFKEGQIQIKGVTTSFEAVNQIKETLTARSDKFVDVAMSDTGPAAKGGITFKLRMGVKGLAPTPKGPKGKGKAT